MSRAEGLQNAVKAYKFYFSCFQLWFHKTTQRKYGRFMSVAGRESHSGSVPREDGEGFCQIATCLHEDKTWNRTAWFKYVSSWMHNASAPWIIYINKWKESVWCFAIPFLLYFHLKGYFFSLKKRKKKNKPPYWSDRWQIGWVSFPESHSVGIGGYHGNRDMVVTW